MVDRKGKAKAREVVDEIEVLEVTEDVIAAEKSTMLAERQLEMEAVNERHDAMVRELFHMLHFRNMLAYNPVEAKQDNSLVFQQFHSNYDLLDQASSMSTGPSMRRTRRATNERQQTLHGSSVSAPPVPPKHKKKMKPHPSNDDASWGILSSPKKGEGKQKMIAEQSAATYPSLSTVSDGEQTNAIHADTVNGDRDVTVSAFVRKKDVKKGTSVPERYESPRSCAKSRDAADEPHVEPVSNGLQTIRRGRVRKGAHDGVTLPDDLHPRKRRKTEPVLLDATSFAVSPKTNGLSLRSKASHTGGTQYPLRNKYTNDAPSTGPPNEQPYSHDTNQDSLPLATKDPPPAPKFNIKRIKLLVRRPPPAISHPLQRPAPARHNSSLRAFFSSYQTLNDQDLSQELFDESVTNDAAIFERVALFRKQGRFIPGTDILFGTKPEEGSFTTPQRTSKDIWDAVVADVITYGRNRPKKPIGKQVASQIATKIQGYWDAHAAKKDKAKLQEERRLRVLAKATIKTVIAEWKKAIFHIREQERLRLEAEELKRGAEHLDAILDQSGHILEAQQGDLARGDMLRSRSRSNSASVSVHPWMSEDEESGGDSDDEDGDEARSDAGTSEVDDREEEDRQADDAHIENIDEAPDDADNAVIEKADEALGVEGDADSDSESDVGVQALIPGYSITRDSSHPSDDNLISESPEPEPSTIIEATHHDDIPTSPLHGSMDTVVDDDDRTLRKAEDSSLIDAENVLELPSDTPTPLADDDILHERDLAATPTGAHAVDKSGLNPESSSNEMPKNNSGQGDGVEASPLEEKREGEADPDKAEVEVASPDAGVDADENEHQDNAETDIPEYLKPYAVAPVEWNLQDKVKPPLLLRGILRPYQQAGLEWLASLHTNNLNGILADEMGLGKTIQTIALLAHLACDRGIWGPHVIIVPTSVLLNWEMEFKKFLPGFKVLSYHGNTKRRKELRQGWNDKYHFNVCITSYTLASRDAHIFKRKPWYYMILDEAHMIKNFKSQRWNILLMFRSFRRLLLTGTPLQNNLTELWALLQFLMSGSNFANLKEFAEWFSNPLEKAIEMGNVLDEETMQRVTKLHTVLRPYLLRRLKRDVEKELPSKYEHLVLCPLSKRQRFLYDEFMSRAHTRDALQSGVYQKIANVLMQLRKVCNHPDLFEVRPIVTSFAMDRSAIADFEIKELLIRRRMLHEVEESVNLDVLGLRFIERQGSSFISAQETKQLDATTRLPFISEIPGEPPPKDTRTIAGFRAYEAWRERAATIARWAHIGYLNRLRCNSFPIYSKEALHLLTQFTNPLLPSPYVDRRFNYLDNIDTANTLVKSYRQREKEVADVIDRFAFATPPVVALDMPRLALSGYEDVIRQQDPSIDDVLHRSSVKLQIAFPDSSLLQYDCGKLQQLARLLREKKMGGHRVLIFTQMTKVLDILEIFMNLHGYLYLRLDGATKIEDRQYITERFNADARIFGFISSSRSGGVGINLTGADTVIFYDSDFNPQMDRQCEDRAHRIGQIRDVHIYRFVSQHTVEEAMLRKANQKRSLDDLVIQKGEFDWRSLFKDEGALTRALGEVEDTEDAHAADIATREEIDMEGADDADFGEDADGSEVPSRSGGGKAEMDPPLIGEGLEQHAEPEGDEEEEEGGTVVEYMLNFVKSDYDFFRDWRL